MATLPPLTAITMHNMARRSKASPECGIFVALQRTNTTNGRAVNDHRACEDPLTPGSVACAIEVARRRTDITRFPARIKRNSELFGDNSQSLTAGSSWTTGGNEVSMCSGTGHRFAPWSTVTAAARSTDFVGRRDVGSDC